MFRAGIFLVLFIGSLLVQIIQGFSLWISIVQTMTALLLLSVPLAAKVIVESKSPQYFDMADGSLKTEHRSWANAIIIAIQLTGLFPVNGVLYQLLAQILTQKFNQANIKFTDQKKDSCAEVRKFASEHGIDWPTVDGIKFDESKWPWSKAPHEYESINDFFMRKYKAYSFGEASVLAPATSVVKQYPNIMEMKCLVKGVQYTLSNCGIPSPDDYAQQACFYYYLSPADYHCFHSPIEGIVEDITDHTGISTYSGSVKFEFIESKPPILIHNRRYVIVVRQGSFKLALVIIGGFLVDSIRIDSAIQKNAKISKGQYVGAFAFGGSAILMLTNAKINVDEAINQALCKSDLPVKVQIGQSFANPQ
eukprot:gnl/MRDRNA2_/MRDRNA2_23770_c0_seq2.p1 gnl/MRDRNA2_/MRDRNA2_23770_c0~~gnl/MRDRNA2_/MRDRNA2_23770_c0_seq2.p1  ORF type:complete len:397 (+),score=59.30 gnl/MRDRNA2_/MRDRNA2_23770_c0_seq2:100-1191(+)